LDLQTLTVAPQDFVHSLNVSFEAAAAGLASIPELFFEPDGSFALIRHTENATMHLDGNVFDRDGRVVYVDIKGTCVNEDFDQVIGVLGWPSGGLMFQLVREAVFLDEDEFRRYAAVSEV
jgi:hypothetical protein